MSGRRPPGRARSTGEKATIVYGILGVLLVLIVMQLWLLTATTNAWLGGDDSVVIPAALASVACLGLNAGLLFYLFRLE
ncbi:MAG TPA: DUF6755 family protein [Planctomycetota bacterium]|nr:DUF6755 family protein [Planctomycetota bacterium]